MLGPEGETLNVVYSKIFNVQGIFKLKILNSKFKKNLITFTD